MRMTKNKRQILDTLRGLVDGDSFLEHGPPPYCAADVVLMAGGNVRNVSRTLRLMEEHGLVHSETVIREQRCEVPKYGHYPRPVTAYWNTTTMEEDRARAKAWRDGSEERSRQAFQTMCERFGW